MQDKCPISTQHFFEYFKSVNDPQSVFFQPDEDILYFNERYLNGELQVMFDELNSPISVEEIKKACATLNNGKSAGPDKLLNEFFKYVVQNLLAISGKPNTIERVSRF